MCSTSTGVSEITDTASAFLVAENAMTPVAFARPSEIVRRTANKYRGNKQRDRMLTALLGEGGFEELKSTMPAAPAELEPANWGSKLAAFTKTAVESREQLIWVAQRFTNDRDEAEDIVQEALFRAFKNLLRFRGESQMGTWLHVIVRNIGLEWVRNRKGKVYVPLEQIRNTDDGPVVLDLPDPGCNPEQCYERGEMDKILLSEIEGLTSIAKRTLQMCVLDELSLVDTASELGVSVNTVKSRLFHGKQMLKRAASLHGRGRKDLLRSMN